MHNQGVITDIGFLATCHDSGGQDDIGFLEGACVAFSEGRITWVGLSAELPAKYSDWSQHDAKGLTVVPGLVDCHTHLAFGGWRADEFSLKMKGASYLDIAASGGGIRKTMRQTRAASEADLLNHCLDYAQKALSLGVTAMECKSGYGLSLEDELKLLRVYKKLEEKVPLDIVATLLAAHVVPPDACKNNPNCANKNDLVCNKNCYIKMICEELIPQVAHERLAQFNDVFVETGAFTADDARKILFAGQQYGLQAKLHIDQLSDGNGGALAAQVHAVSADHLEFTSDEGIRLMAEAGVVAVCLPFASLYLNQPPMKARRFIDAGVPVAVATDFNPGSAPSYDLALAMMLACTTSRMTPSESLKGATLYAAKAIKKSNEYGSIEVGKRANFAIINAPNVDQWLYHYQPNLCVQTWINGQRVHNAPGILSS